MCSVVAAFYWSFRLCDASNPNNLIKWINFVADSHGFSSETNFTFSIISFFSSSFGCCCRCCLGCLLFTNGLSEGQLLCRTIFVIDEWHGLTPIFGRWALRNLKFDYFQQLARMRSRGTAAWLSVLKHSRASHALIQLCHEIMFAIELNWTKPLANRFSLKSSIIQLFLSNMFTPPYTFDK